MSKGSALIQFLRSYQRILLFGIAMLFLTLATQWIMARILKQHLLLTDVEEQYLREKKTLVFVGQTEYPPFEFVTEKDQYDGMTIELIRWMAVEFGFKAEIVHKSFQEAQADVQTGKADVITSLFYDEARSKKFEFSDELFKVPASIFIHADRSDIKELADLKGKKIAMQRGDFAEIFLNKHNIAVTYIYTENFAAATDSVSKKAADAVIGDEQIVLYHIFSNNLNDVVKKIGNPLYEGKDCLATKKGNRILIGILNKGIQQAIETKTLEKITRKWLGETLAKSWLEKNKSVILIVFGGVSVLLIGVWSWNFQLRREIFHQTAALRESHASLQESQQRLKDITDNIDAYLWSMDISAGKIVKRLYTENVAKITGYELSEILSPVPEFWLNIIHPNDSALFSDGMARILAGAAVALEYRIIRRDGSIRWLYDSSQPQLNAKNEVTHTHGVTIDITDKKHGEIILREQEERLKRAEALSQMMIVHQSLDGHWLKVPQKLCALLDYSEEYIINQTYKDIFHADDEAVYWQACQKLIHGGAEYFDTECRFIRRNGDVAWVELNGSLVLELDGKPVHFLIYIRDITDRKRAQDALKRYAVELEKSNRELQDFASVASHDLQEPLRKIQVFAGRLESKYKSSLSGDGLDYLHRMRNAADRMQRLIDALLSLARVKTRAQPFVKVDLNIIIQDVLTDLEVPIDQTQAHIVCDALPTIEADPLQMQQLFQNLIGNAIKFRKNDQTPEIRITTPPAEDETGHDFCRIEVQDNGIGFEEKYAERIFTIFQRLHGQAQYEGAGIGLAICRRICDRHEGALTATGIPGAGATFTVTLPYKQSEGA